MIQIKQLEIFLPQEVKQQVKSKKTGTVLPTDLTISSAGGEISLFPSVALDDGLTLTDGAPQKWALELPDTSWSATSSGEYEREMTLRILVPKQKQTPTTSFSVNYRLYVCHEHSECSMQNLCFVGIVIYAEGAPAKVVHHFTHIIRLLSNAIFKQ